MKFINWWLEIKKKKSFAFSDLRFVKWSYNWRDRWSVYRKTKVITFLQRDAKGQENADREVRRSTQHREEESNAKLIKLITTFRWQFPTRHGGPTTERVAFMWTCTYIHTYVRLARRKRVSLNKLPRSFFELSCSRAVPTAKMQRKISGRFGDYLGKFKSI